MFCPKCGQQALDNLKRCPACGLALDEVKNLLLDNLSPQANRPRIEQGSLTPYQKGIRQGFQLVLLSVILIPAYVLLGALFPPDDVLFESAPSDTAFEKISQAILATLLMVGLARLVYAYLFERGGQEGPAHQASPGSGKLLFSSAATSIEAEELRTAELVEPDRAMEQEPDRIKRR